MSEETIEIYRDAVPGARRVIWIEARGDGSVGLAAQDIGKTVEAVWGDSDYEFWFGVKAEQKDALLLALLKDKYAGRTQAVDEFRAFCAAAGIAGEGGSWA